jgi:large subunit ribosomal protein L16
VLFEVGGGVPIELARESMALAQAKLPIKTKFVVRPDYVPAETPVRV